MAGDNYWFGGGSTGTAIFGGYSTSGSIVYYSGNGSSAEVAAAQAQAYAEYKAVMDKALQTQYVMRLVAELTKFEDVEGTLV